MHPALLIDEILKIILELCAEWHPRDYNWTLYQVALSCKAWKDPALDELWRRLPDVTPLIRLLPEHCPYIRIRTLRDVDLTTFHSYASRVRHIKHNQAVIIFSAFRGLLALPRLAAVQFHYGGCDTASNWKATNATRTVDIVSLFRRQRDSTDRRSAALADYLNELKFCGGNLETLRIRGSLMTEPLNRAVESLETLTTLVLHVGNTLTAHTLAAIVALPHLQDLDLHASHIDADELLAACASCDGRSFFPTLSRLRIRAEPVLLQTLLLQILPAGVLRSLHMDVISPAGPQSLRPVFNVLTQYVVPSLEELVIEDFTSAEDIDDISSILAGEYWFSMGLLRPLGKLRGLRHFTITALFPPDLCDDELAELCSWWPHLEALDLGALECPASLPGSWTARMTPSALLALARQCRRLRRAALPMDVSSCDAFLRLPDLADGRLGATSPHALRSLCIGMLPQAPASAAAFARFVHALFPSLVEIESALSGQTLQLDNGAVL
ncbi:hypothetical protein B0H21DRAFT_696585 [Amylocystis lapponica]|nr:hypothetical protein B0H21DRAFT_696585 [Amylocystis lapponica]